MSNLFDLPFEEPEAGPVPATARHVYSVSELTADIRERLESRFAEVWVEGEISNCRLWNTGHLYFTLKDTAAQIRAIMFRSALRYLRFKPADGLRIIARGRVSVYDPKGEYQLVCEHMEPQGLGALQLAFEQLKRRLEAEGLFDPGRKRPLPALPRRIGLVTSLDGAALRDIIKVLGRRYPDAHLVIRPARVQGDGAADDLSRGIAQLARIPRVDVVIVARGGGSIEDLWAFNDERVARALAASPVPTISAVGHEVDYTIADFVADVRAPTPSAAAEIVVARKEEFCSRIDRLRDRLAAAARAGLGRAATRVRRLEARPALAGLPARVAMRGRHVAELSHALATTGRALLTRRERRYQVLRLQLEARDLRRRLATIHGRLGSVVGRLGGAAARVRRDRMTELQVLTGRLESLSPLAVLARGYAVCWNAERTEIIRDAARTAESVRVTLARGELECRVTRRHLEPDNQ